MIHTVIFPIQDNIVLFCHIDRLFLFWKCLFKEMWQIRSKFTRDEEHAQSNCFLMIVMCHETKKGKLLDVNERDAFDIDS